MDLLHSIWNRTNSGFTNYKYPWTAWGVSFCNLTLHEGAPEFPDFCVCVCVCMCVSQENGLEEEEDEEESSEESESESESEQSSTEGYTPVKAKDCKSTSPIYECVCITGLVSYYHQLHVPTKKVSGKVSGEKSGGGSKAHAEPSLLDLDGCEYTCTHTHEHTHTSTHTHTHIHTHTH